MWNLIAILKKKKPELNEEKLKDIIVIYDGADVILYKKKTPVK